MSFCFRAPRNQDVAENNNNNNNYILTIDETKLIGSRVTLDHRYSPVGI